MEHSNIMRTPKAMMMLERGLLERGLLVLMVVMLVRQVCNAAECM